MKYHLVWAQEDMQDPFEIKGDLNPTVILGLKMKCIIHRVSLWIRFSYEPPF